MNFSSSDLLSMRKDPRVFREFLHIDNDGHETPFAEVMDGWQKQDFDAIDKALKRLVLGEADEGTKSRIYLERPRGHSKTTDIGVMVLWTLAFCPRIIKGIAAAADKDQAALIVQAINKLLKLNEWLDEFVIVTRDKVRNPDTGSELTVVACDAMSSYGELPDFIVCDEFTHWPKESLWNSLFSSAAKRSRCVLVVISNAGNTGSWQFDIYEKIRKDKAWYFHSLPGPVASFLNPEYLEEQERLLPPMVYARLWLNRWTSGKGTAIETGIIEASVKSELSPLAFGSPGWAYAAGLDLGISRDTAAFCIVGRSRQGVFRLAFMKSWTPTKDRNVEIEEVEKAIIAAYGAFRFSCGFADPWQGTYLLERLAKRKINITQYTFPPVHLDRLARNTLNQFREGNVQMFNHLGTVEELKATSIVEMTNGYLRLEWPKSKTTHGDHACAFSLGLLAAKDAKMPTPVRRPQSVPYKRDNVRQGRRDRVSRLLRDAS